MENRNMNIVIRMTRDEKEKIEKRAEAAGENVSGYMRKTALGKTFKAVLINGDKNFSEELHNLYIDFARNAGYMKK